MGQGQEQRQQTPAASAPAQEAAPAREGDAQDTLGNAAILQRMGAGEEGSEGSEAAPPAAATDEHVTLNVNVSNSTWPIAGSLVDIADEVEARQQGAHVSWNPSYAVVTENDGEYDFVTEVTIEIPITKEMPEWTNKNEAPAEDQAEWERFIRCLETHEQGHITRARQGFMRLGRMMINTSPEAARLSFERGVVEVQSNSDTYDQETGHGRSQEAVLRA